VSESEGLLALREAAHRGERGRATRRRLGLTLAEAEGNLRAALAELAEANGLLRPGQVWADGPRPTVVFTVTRVWEKAYDRPISTRVRATGLQADGDEAVERDLDAASVVKLFPHLLVDAAPERPEDK
jgi:hypothetical protein